MSFDLKSLSVDPDNQTAEMVLEHPGTGEPITDESDSKAIFVIYGPDSQERKAFSRKTLNKFTRKGKKNKGFDFDEEYAERLIMDRAVAAIADWKNIAFEGQELKCNEENKRKVLEAAPWIRRQIIRFMDDEENFFQG